MATVTVTSKNFAFKDDGSHMRDASFSSYLCNGEEDFVLKLGESTRIRTSAAVSAAESPSQLSFGRKYNKGDDEIGIFTAEKYFNGGMDTMEIANAEKRWKQQPNEEGKIIDLQRQRKAFKFGTPSASSEASWNSQSALMQKYQSPYLQKQMSGKNFFSSFGCNCTGKKSVDVAKKGGKNRNPSHCKKFVDLEGPHNSEMFVNGPFDVGQTRFIMSGSDQNHLEFKYGEQMDPRIGDKMIVASKREDPFTFPNLKPAVGNHLTDGKQFEEAEKARISLEVFGSNPNSTYMMVKEAIGSDLNRKLTMLASDTGRRPVENVAPSSSGIDDGDVGSDGSSDLFEIESFSSKAHHPFFHPQAPDDMSSCYEPSEASIEWSVVTASAANFSIASDYEFQKPTEKIITTTAVTNAKAAIAKGAQRRQHASLLGCRNAKAVMIVANTKRVSEKAEPDLRRLQSESISTSARFQAQNRLMGIESGDQERAFSFRTTHAPHSLYMH